MLDKKIAQKIADEVMNNLGYNINVMNKEAFIIGSGSPERIGTFHETAMKAIRQAIICEVTESQAKNLMGVRPGINLPIVDKNNKVIGVVGITGDSNEVRNIGKLVKMTAELIIEQQESMIRFYSHRNDKSNFLNTLIYDPMSIGENELRDWGRRIGYQMDQPRVALLLTYYTGKLEAKKSVLESELNQIKTSDRHLKNDMSALLSEDYLVIFKTIEKTEPWELEKSINDYLAGAVGLKSLHEWTAYVGGFYSGLSGYQKSYREAYNMFRSVTLTASQSVYFAHHYYDLKLYWQLDREIRTGVLEPYLKKIQSYFGKGTEDAIMTMQKLYDYDFQYKKVAMELFIHRNTVIFRKKKMEECLGFTINGSGNERILFQLLLIHYERLKLEKNLEHDILMRFE
ncbi:sugar diacid recognition domain-containing protein [Eubacteriaceae bacterium ES3]|nr:sugar diacid recognition domain-containing protein [Eubacteriaceae bacterium ES3]